MMGNDGLFACLYAEILGFKGLAGMNRRDFQMESELPGREPEKAFLNGLFFVK